MVHTARVVEHLRLRAESESAIRHSLPALEDAFRTASLPDAGARLICVRRLHLGQIPSNASPQGLARRIEQRFAAADWPVVHAGDASGDDAQAVWFRDPFEAHEIAALRLATGHPLDAWFWPLALPGVMAQPPDQRFRATAFAIAATEEAPGALPAWTASLVRAGYRERLIAVLRPGDGHALLRAAGVSHGPVERATTTLARFTDEPDVQLTNGPVDDREIFVEAMVGRPSGCAMHSRPSQRTTRRPAAAVERTVEPAWDGIRGTAPAADVDAPTHPARETAQAHHAHETAAVVAQQTDIERQALASPARHDELAGDPLAGADNTQAAVAQSAAFVAGEQVARHSSQPLTARDARQPSDADARDRSAGDAYEALASPWRLPYAAATSAGGLLFLLPVLEQVGFGKWAAERGPAEPEPEVLAAEILNLLLSRLRVAEDDPVWELAAAFRPKPEATGELEGQRGFRLQAEGGVHAETWLAACRRFLRRRVRIGFASLVLRRARLAITSTHVDVFFGLSAADLRIRRAGLDIDPGWVPWFARVVSFHYEDRPWQ
jgi:hypothetical protein